MKNLTISVLGGTGKMGQWFARIFKMKGWRVIISGRNPVKAKNVGELLKVEHRLANVQAAKESDIALVATSLPEVSSTIREVASHMHKNSLIIDIASVKSSVAPALLEATTRGLKAVSMHPMFGPGALSLEGQRMLLIPVGGDKESVGYVQKLFEDDGVIFHVIPDAATHDALMAYTLCLPHCLNILFAKTVKGYSLEELKKYAGTTFTLQLALAEAVMSEDPKLYAEIQLENPYVTPILANFIESAKNLQATLEAKDVKVFTQIFEVAQRHVAEDPDFAKAYQRFYAMLKAARSV